jgi:GST-like protein
MIDFYYWTTPHGHKISIMPEETGLPYTVKPVNIGKGDQLDPAFLAISPNKRIPAIVDRLPATTSGTTRPAHRFAVTVPPMPTSRPS